MKTNILIVSVALFATMSGSLAAVSAAPAAIPAPLVCPVTGNKIAAIKAAAGHETYKGKTYYFCCAGCKPKFDKNPDQYIKNAAKGKYDKM